AGFLPDPDRRHRGWHLLLGAVRLAAAPAPGRDEAGPDAEDARRDGAGASALSPGHGPHAETAAHGSLFRFHVREMLSGGKACRRPGPASGGHPAVIRVASQGPLSPRRG